MKKRDQRHHMFGCLTEYIVSCRKSGALLAMLAAALFLPLGLEAATAGAADCTKLLGLNLKDTVITEATVIAAKDDVPEYCRVQGGLETVILFEVALPTKTWNNKFFYVGGAGTTDRFRNSPTRSPGDTPRPVQTPDIAAFTGMRPQCTTILNRK